MRRSISLILALCLVPSVALAHDGHNAQMVGRILGGIAGALMGPPYPPLPQPYAYDPSGNPAPPATASTPDPLGAQIKSEIYAFCSTHAAETFCVDLDRYLQLHPDAR